MKRASFLASLFKERKLQLVEPSEEIRYSYMQKSESNLISAKILLENNRLEESVSLAYYGMYHMATALLFSVGIKCENHAGAIIILKEVFGIDNTSISFAKKERIDKQYYTDFQVTKQEVADSIRSAEDFCNAMADFISRLDSQKTNEFRKRLVSLTN